MTKRQGWLLLSLLAALLTLGLLWVGSKKKSPSSLPNRLHLGPPVVDLKAPPMGFMSWEKFRCEINCTAHPKDCISEVLYLETAQAMLDGGYVEAGYKRVDIDDCWMARERDPTTQRLVAEPQRFPSGMKYLADSLHQVGMLLGTYSDVGSHTCGGFPGSQDYELLDAQTFSEWGMDYLKLDGCYMEPSDYPAYYTKWGSALKQVARPMVFSCSWPAYLGNNESTKPFDVMYHQAGCNTWRNWADIDNAWASLKGIVMHWAQYAQALRTRLPPGAFHDADMLLVGDDHYGKVLPIQQARLQMGFWALIASPLFIGGDVRTIPEEYRRILLNREIIAINQDAGRHMAQCVYGYPTDSTRNPEEQQVWVKTLQGGRSVALGFFNLDEAQSFSIQHGHVFDPGTRIAKCLDLWAPGGSFVNLCARQHSSAKTRWIIVQRQLDNGGMELQVTVKNVEPTSHQMLRIDLVEEQMIKA